MKPFVKSIIKSYYFDHQSLVELKEYNNWLYLFFFIVFFIIISISQVFIPDRSLYDVILNSIMCLILRVIELVLLLLFFNKCQKKIVFQAHVIPFYLGIITIFFQSNQTIFSLIDSIFGIYSMYYFYRYFIANCQLYNKTIVAIMRFVFFIIAKLCSMGLLFLYEKFIKKL